MDTLEAIAKRHSYRGRYTGAAVPREDLVKLTEAGAAAPSACNRQTAAFIAVDDPALLAEMTKLVKGNGFAGQAAPAGVCVLSRHAPAYADVYFCEQDYAAAIENILLAATALGYASCWIEGQVTQDAGTQEQLAALLGAPDGYTVVAFLPVGVAAEAAKRPRYKPLAERAWVNRFGQQ